MVPANSLMCKKPQLSADTTHYMSLFKRTTKAMPKDIGAILYTMSEQVEGNSVTLGLS